MPATTDSLEYESSSSVETPLNGVEDLQRLNELEDLQRPITQTYSFEIGGQTALPTYISPITYSGNLYAFTGNWVKAMPCNPRRALMRFEARAWYSALHNPRKTSRMQSLGGHIAWQMSARYNLTGNLNCFVGGGPKMEASLYALLKNSNNPVAVNIHPSLTFNAGATYRFAIKRLPALAEIRLSSSAIGAFFMPGYEETFYEIYLGNRSKLVHCSWWGNNPNLNASLTATLDFGKTAMTLGYAYYGGETHANHLVMRHNMHCFTIGIVPHGLGLKRKDTGKKNYFYGY